MVHLQWFWVRDIVVDKFILFYLRVAVSIFAIAILKIIIPCN